MTDKEKRAQVAKQCRAIVHMAEALADVYRAKASSFESDSPGPDQLIELVGKWSAGHMETLGDILNGMDAVDDDEDAWLDPIFKEAHRLWPDSGAQTAF